MTALWALVGMLTGKVWRWVTKSPGCWVVLSVAAALALWGVHHHGYVAGRAECEAAHQVAAARAVIAQERHNASAVAASEARTAADTRIAYRNKEIIRYVAVKAATLPGGSDVCVPADLADRLRGLE